MSFLPDWAPHIHPLIVHFPIALLFAAVLFDVVALLVKRNKMLHTSAVMVYVVGALAVLVAFLSGQDAGDLADVPAAAQTVLTDHANWAEWTLWFFGGYALVRLALLFINRQGRVMLWAPFTVIGMAGLFLVWQTAEHGAQMVFQHGVGVQAVQTLQEEAREARLAAQATASETTGPQQEEDGSWFWKPRTPGAWKEAFLWVTGSENNLASSLVDDAAQGIVLSLSPADSATLFVLFQALESVQADARINLDEFQGTVSLIHHAQDAQNYYFLRIGNGQIQQGYVSEGAATVMDDKPFGAGGWHPYRVVGDKTHFRGYADGELITHGHTDAPNPGYVGLLLEGTGSVLLDFIDVQSLR